MPSMNKAQLIGHLGRDPDMKTTQSGKSVCNFSIATSNKNFTEWHRICCWNKLAELCGEWLCKGDLVYAEGPIQTQEWTDSNGVKRESKQIVAHTVYFLKTKKRDAPKEMQPPRDSQTDFEEKGSFLDDSDIPF